MTDAMTDDAREPHVTAEDTIEFDPEPLGCYDCGFAYGGLGWCDVLVPDWAWLRISPTGHQGGTLCFNCMARRLARLGLSDVPVAIVSGPYRVADRDEPLPPSWLRQSGVAAAAGGSGEG